MSTTRAVKAAGTHDMKAGNHFLHFGVSGNGRHKVPFTPREKTK